VTVVSQCHDPCTNSRLQLLIVASCQRRALRVCIGDCAADASRDDHFYVRGVGELLSRFAWLRDYDCINLHCYGVSLPTVVQGTPYTLLNRSTRKTAFVVATVIRSAGEDNNGLVTHASRGK
jgi:hypothetical protein